METKITELKRGDLFIFNGHEFKVLKKFKEWTKKDDAYLIAFSTRFLFCERFYNDSLIVHKSTNNEKP